MSRQENNGLSEFNFGPSQFQNLIYLVGYDTRAAPFTTPCTSDSRCDLPEETVNDVVQAVDLVSGSSVANSTGDGAPNTGEQEQKPENETSVAPAAVEADATIGDNSAHTLAPPTRPEASKPPRFSFKLLGFIYGFMANKAHCLPLKSMQRRRKRTRHPCCSYL